MKKLLCMILALSFLLTMGCALADQSLYDMWIDYTYDYPDFAGKPRARSHEFGRYVEGCWVDTTSDYLLREYMQIKSGGTAEDLISAWSRFEGEIPLPLLEMLARDISYVNAEIGRSESYSFYKGSTETGMLELYWLDISIDKPGMKEDCGVIVCVQDCYGDISVEYTTVYGNPEYYPRSATSNYLGDMFVYFCDEWISLREEPSTKAARLEKVPKYAVVTDCHHLGDNGFVYCNYNGQSGFVLWEYLSPMEYMDYALSHG